MRNNHTIILIFFLLSDFVSAQNMADFSGGWEGKINDDGAFNLTVDIEILPDDNAVFRISDSRGIICRQKCMFNEGLISAKIDSGPEFKGEINNDKTAISGFIKSGLLLYHLDLKKNNDNRYTGVWNVLMVDKLKSPLIYLSVENGSEDEYQAYPVFADDRFTGTWCGDFRKSKDTIFFTDFKTGLKFEGKLYSSTIMLDVKTGTNTITQVEFHKFETEWQTGNLLSENTLNLSEDKWLKTMESDIKSGILLKTHSVLISREDELVYEKYFEGYDAIIPHDMRSASKSISSAIVGIASDKGLIKNTGQSIYEFLPEKYQHTKDSLKSKISLFSLLTMSSGLDAIDFGTDRHSVASEDNYQPTRDWTRTILEASMINLPETHASYGSANPYLLGVTIDSVIAEPVEMFMDRNLFQPLKISNYIIQTDMTGRPYFGGGMYLSPHDMLKFGRLYLNEGSLENEQILSKEWVEQSFGNYFNLENTTDKNGYGFLWWHKTYRVNGKEIESVEARGAGGQYIFVIPGLKVVVVITSGNYRNGKFQQPELILEKYLLPFLLDLKE